jgi:hypothetical protein
MRQGCLRVLLPDPLSGSAVVVWTGSPTPVRECAHSPQTECDKEAFPGIGAGVVGLWRRCATGFSSGAPVGHRPPGMNRFEVDLRGG